MAVTDGGEPEADAAWLSQALPDQCAGICNAVTPTDPIDTPQGGTGDVTMYSTSTSQGGACNYGTTNVAFYAAMSVDEQPGDGNGAWQGGRICGECAEVTALTSLGPKSTFVRIMDKCPDAYCGVDLGGDAPAAVMVDGFGRYLGQWTFGSCAGHPEVSDGPPALTVSASANADWSIVQVRNPPSAVTSITWQDVADAGNAGELPYSGELSENTYEVPLEILQAGATWMVTIQYREDPPATLQISSQELAAPGASYTLP
ncbi:MAG: expansin-like protein [Polyangiaceae bacterium]